MQTAVRWWLCEKGGRQRGKGGAVERWESFKMAAIRDGLGRVRVAGEAIYQSWREREEEKDPSGGLLQPR